MTQEKEIVYLETKDISEEVVGRKKPRRILTCKGCNREFSRPHSRPLPEETFCSIPCRKEYQKTMIFGTGMMYLYEKNRILHSNRFNGKANFKELYKKFSSEELYKGLELRILFD